MSSKSVRFYKREAAEEFCRSLRARGFVHEKPAVRQEWIKPGTFRTQTYVVGKRKQRRAYRVAWREKEAGDEPVRW